MRKFLGLVALLLALTNTGAADSVESSTAPAVFPEATQPQEVFRYELRWKFLYAGEVELSSKTEHIAATGQTKHFELTAKTTGVLGSVYPVNNRVESTVDAELTHSYFYEKHLREDQHYRDATALFDWSKKTLAGTCNERRFKQSLSATRLLDPLAAYFYLRTLPELCVGKTYPIPLSDGEFIEQCPVKVLGIEKVDTEAGAFECYKLEPVLDKVQGIFRKRGDAPIYLWMTTDSRRIPVMLESEAPVGRFRAILTGINSAPSATAPNDPTGQTSLGAKKHTDSTPRG